MLMIGQYKQIAHWCKFLNKNFKNSQKMKCGPHPENSKQQLGPRIQWNFAPSKTTPASEITLRPMGGTNRPNQATLNEFQAASSAQNPVLSQLSGNKTTPHHV